MQKLDDLATKAARLEVEMTDIVRVTPLLGGKTDGAVCSLLEIGGSRILLDCGGVVDFDFNGLLSIASELVVGGGIDAVVIRSVSRLKDS